MCRSTLLYYESIGLLVASERNHVNYREYSEDDCRRLEQICIFRQAGVPLKDIARILCYEPSDTARLLSRRIKELDKEIDELRAQQQLIISILHNEQFHQGFDPLNEESWIELLVDAGFTREDRWRWHRYFEQSSPERHCKFLESLGLSAEEIEQVRAWALEPYDAENL